MNFVDILYNLVIGPLQLVFEIIFNMANRLTHHPGLSIIVLSTVMNFLVLPLYKRADEMQEEQRAIEEKLEKGAAHIKKTFSGDEKMMILNTYYKQNHYKPTDALNGTVSLLLQVPFFMAAYNFLANLSLLEGVSLGPITDLSQPDSLFTIGGFVVNVLPILMTLINVISTLIYTKGQPFKSKIMLFVMAAFFLVFLYTSPAGLVFYWTLNNVFALLKNVVYKINIKTPKISLVKTKAKAKAKYIYFLCGGLLTSIFVGLYIPSTFIAASPEEFVDVTYFYHPINYLLQSCSIALGFFVIWMGIFYWLAGTKVRIFFERILWIMNTMFLVNYLFFGKNLGILLPNLQYENGMRFSTHENLLNLGVLALVVILIFVLSLKFGKQLHQLFVVVMMAFIVMSGINIAKTNNEIAEYSDRMGQYVAEQPSFNLSKDGENVVVIMADRALGYMLPYIMEERPELLEQFDGFTWYKNTISYGGSTNFGVPGVYGGYEYIPTEMNKREDEKLVDKHNEALKVLPHIYDENGYDVTVLDPSYANYKWIPDLSIYDEYKNIHAYNTEGMFADEDDALRAIAGNNRNFFCFAVMKSFPTVLQPYIYNSANYWSLQGGKYSYNFQDIQSLTAATGIAATFMKSYEVLDNMEKVSVISDDSSKNFVIMANETPHDAVLLQMPNYEPKPDVDNTQYFEEVKKSYSIDGIELNMDDEKQVAHYHVNIATLIQLGEWMEFLKENDVYDNTRIIIVSDHGGWLNQIDEQILTFGLLNFDMGSYRPLLMVKDFNSTGFEVSDEFMTNADVPTLATEGIIANPVNPFTGNAINSDYKNKNENYLTLSEDWDVLANDGNVFNESRWLKVESGDTYNLDNWTYIDEITTSPQGLKGMKGQ